MVFSQILFEKRAKLVPVRSNVTERQWVTVWLPRLGETFPKIISFANAQSSLKLIFVLFTKLNYRNVSKRGLLGQSLAVKKLHFVEERRHVNFCLTIMCENQKHQLLAFIQTFKSPRSEKSLSFSFLLVFSQSVSTTRYMLIYLCSKAFI